MKKHYVVAIAAALIAASTATAAFAAETGELPVSVQAEQQVGAANSEEDETGANYPVITDFSCTGTGIKVYWSAYPKAARYGLFYRDASGWHGIATTTSLSMEYDGLKNETEYTFTVRALDKNYDFISDFNRDGWSCTYIAPPVINSLSAASDGVKISWNKSNAASRYRVYRKDSSHGWARIGDTKDTTFTDKSASSGTRYTYTVRTLTDDGSRETSFYNDGKSITFVATPVVTEIYNINNGSVIYWNACKGAARYGVFYHDDNGWHGIGTTTDTEYTVKGLKTNTAYTYTVRCLDSDGDFVSDFNREGWTNTYLAPPVISSLQHTENGVTINWKKCAGAERYRVYRKDDSHGWARIGETAGTSFEDNNAQSGVRYSYTVRCISADSSRETSYFNEGKSISFVATPVVTEIENGNGSSTIYWKACGGAARYGVFYRDAQGEWHGIASTSDTYYTHKGLKHNQTTTYTVRCLDKNGDFVSDFNREGWTNTYLAPPVITRVSSGVDGVDVEWKKLPGEARFRVYRKDASHGWSRVGETAEGFFTDKSAQSGKTYSYTVRSITADSSKETSYYNEGKSLYYVATPKISAAENGSGSVTLYWKECSGAKAYRVFYLTADGWKGLGNTSGTSYTHEGLKSSQTVTYTVRCLDGSGDFVSGYDKTGFVHRYIAPPVINSVVKAAKGYTVSWEAVEGVSSYRLYRRTVTSGWARLSDAVEGTSYTDAAAEANHLYTYTLRCLDEKGNTITDYIDDTVFYINGAVANGNVTDSGNTYYFENGHFRSGYQRIGGKLYYYENGKVQKDAIVGSSSEGWTYAGEDGVCCESEEIKLAAKFMMEKCKGNTRYERQKYGFLYMAKNFPYRRSYDHPKKASDIAPLAIDLYQRESGNCYRYAAAYACLAKIAGLRTRMCIGTTSGLPHGWTEVMVDGTWYICDVDAQLPGYGYGDYKAYMMRSHFWGISATDKFELTIKDGKAIWG
ncbi:MAG: transglutaminase domain-containing protein [Ruminococcus sp.]